MFICKEIGPYIIQKIYEDRNVIVKNLGNSKVFIVKSKELTTFPITDKASEMEF